MQDAFRSTGPWFWKASLRHVASTFGASNGADMDRPRVHEGPCAKSTSAICSIVRYNNTCLQPYRPALETGGCEAEAYPDYDVEMHPMLVGGSHVLAIGIFSTADDDDDDAETIVPMCRLITSFVLCRLSRVPRGSIMCAYNRRCWVFPPRISQRPQICTGCHCGFLSSKDSNEV